MTKRHDRGARGCHDEDHRPAVEWRHAMLKLPARPAPPPQCPRCRGPLLPDYDDDYRCLYCGECVYATAPPCVSRSLIPAGRKPGRPRKQPWLA